MREVECSVDSSNHSKYSLHTNSIPQPLIHGRIQSTCQASDNIVGCSCDDGCIERKLPDTAGRGGFIGWGCACKAICFTRTLAREQATRMKTKIQNIFANVSISVRKSTHGSCARIHDK